MNKPRVWVSSAVYPGYSEDLVTGFKEAGCRCKKVTFEKENIPSRKPDLICGLEINGKAHHFSQKYNIPHAVWYMDKIMNLDHLGMEGFKDKYVFVTYKEDLDRSYPAGPKDVSYLPFFPVILPTSIPNSPYEYQYDVSFVGRALRSHSNDYPDFRTEIRRQAEKEIPEASFLDKLLETLDSILEQQETYSLENEYGIPEFAEEHLSGVEFEIGDQLFDEEVLTLLLGKESSARHRQLIMERLEGIDIFGNDEWREVDYGDNRFRGYTDLRTESARVFARSKINLGIQRIHALDGLSNRVFSVMKSGGFLLSNKLEPMGELFEKGKHYDEFETIEELNEKIDYYLDHEEERKQIARQGQNEINNNHLIKHRAEEILSETGIRDTSLNQT